MKNVLREFLVASYASGLLVYLIILAVLIVLATH